MRPLVARSIHGIRPTFIGHFKGRVIRDVSHSTPDQLVCRPADHMFTAAHPLRGRIYTVSVGGRLVGRGHTLGLGVTSELVIKLRECARPRVRDGSPALIFDRRHGRRS